jgi:hypothetical protein
VYAVRYAARLGGVRLGHWWRLQCLFTSNYPVAVGLFFPFCWRLVLMNFATCFESMMWW